MTFLFFCLSSLLVLSPVQTGANCVHGSEAALPEKAQLARVREPAQASAFRKFRVRRIHAVGTVHYIEHYPPPDWLISRVERLQLTAAHEFYRILEMDAKIISLKYDSWTRL
jgi:hypothetical protein